LAILCRIPERKGKRDKQKSNKTIGKEADANNYLSFRFHPQILILCMDIYRFIDDLPHHEL